MSGFRLRFLTRPGCHLCDDARPLIARAAAQLGTPWEEVNVEQSAELEATYGERVPVLLDPDDTVIAEGAIDDFRLLKRSVRRSARSAS